MFALGKIFLGTLAMLSYVLTIFCIVRFFDAISLTNGVIMVGVWLLTLALLRAADYQPSSARQSRRRLIA